MRLATGIPLILAGLIVVTGCGKKTDEAASAPASTAASGASAAPAASEATAAKVAGKAEVKAGENSIIVQGSGNADVGPIVFDQPYYVVKATYEAAEYSMLEVTYKQTLGGEEIENSLVTTPPRVNSMRVFQVDRQGKPAREMKFQVKSSGTYTIEFLKPAAVASAQAAPKTFTGGAGYTMTPLVKTAGNYVMLRLKYTGAVDPARVGGMPLASANLYDAATGDPWVRNQNVYDHNVQSQDGYTAPKPGTYFAIVDCSKEGGSWEVTITEKS